MLRSTISCLALLIVASPLLAQQGSSAADGLPAIVADAVVDFFNDPRRARFEGPARIPADSTVRRDVAALGGPLVVAGSVRGSIVMVNGDVELLPGSEVWGDITIVGGSIAGLEAGSVSGSIEVHPDSLRYRREGDRIVRVLPLRSERGAEPSEPRWGRSDFLVSTGRSYNRVEGLPITFGPRIRTAGSNPLRVHALGIYRTESGLTLDTDRMGYHVRAEQFLGGRRTLRLGGSAYSTVDPIEDWHLTDLENGLATFLFHRDYRDHFERTGVSLFSIWEPGRGPLALTAEARWEKHASVAARNPWTVFDNAGPWRLQPLVAHGRVSVLAAQAEYDTRSDPANPATGWYLKARMEQSLDSDLAHPLAFAAEPVRPAAPALRYDAFSAGIVDVRRYNRVDPTSRLNFRLVLAGSLDGSALPPQYQHAMGGEGSLPGYSVFTRDCGARSVIYERPGSPTGAAGPEFFGHYGCDAIALLQAEYRGKLSFRFDWGDDPWGDEDPEDEEEGWGFGWDFAPDWVVFVDAARGWARDERPDESLAADVGVGFLVDRFGLYAAVPLSGSSGLNVFVRLGPRF